MSSTPSKIDRLNSANGAAPRTAWNSSSTSHALHRDHRDDLLREHVERIARVAARLDLRLVHRARDGGARDQVAAYFGTMMPRLG